VTLATVVTVACNDSGRAGDTAVPIVPGDSPAATPTPPRDTNVVLITGPTILAAFPVTEREASTSTAVGEMLENFQRHVESAADSLEADSIAVHERYGPMLLWQLGDTTDTRMVPSDRPVYVLISPTHGQTFVLGIQTAEKLVELARRHFRR
jgi:hypothetical protein